MHTMQYRWAGDGVVRAIKAAKVAPMRVGWLLAYTEGLSEDFWRMPG